MSMKKNTALWMTRRQFLKRSAAAGASVAAALPSSTWSRPAGANNDIRVAVVGLGGQGRGHVRRFKVMKGVRVVALCDPDRKRMEKAAEE
ncbi:MAG: twin-arginine translocation signal domain-containing protein, partial [Planctomycetota bacterium]